MGTRDAYQNMMDDLQEKAQMIEWLSKHTVMVSGRSVQVYLEGVWNNYYEDTFLNSIRKAMTEHV